MAKPITIGDEVRRILKAYKGDIITEDKALDRLLEKFQLMQQNQSLAMQEESIRLGKIGVDLQAEQNVIFKQLLDVLAVKTKHD